MDNKSKLAEDVLWTPAYRVIKTKVCTDMEPLAQLISVLFDTLNSEVFDNLPVVAKVSAIKYVATVYGGTDEFNHKWEGSYDSKEESQL